MCIIMLVNAIVAFSGLRKLQLTVLNLQLISEVILQEGINIPVVFKSMSEDMGGYYNPREEYIALNIAYISNVKIVDTLYHEWRHWQQHRKNSSFMDGYIPSDVCYQSYMLQHIEVDARRYGYVMLSKKLREHKRYIANFVLKASYHPFSGGHYKRLRKAT
jgi:hypothetical protein